MSPFLIENLVLKNSKAFSQYVQYKALKEDNYHLRTINVFIYSTFQIF